MLTRRDVCKRLGIGKDRFYELVRSGELAAIKTDTKRNSPYKVSEESLADYCERVKVVPDRAAAS